MGHGKEATERVRKDLREAWNQRGSSDHAIHPSAAQDESVGYPAVSTAGHRWPPSGGSFSSGHVLFSEPF